jgi:hypothetical protein
MIFGKRVSEYLAFQKPVLIAIAAVGLARLVLSLAGLPDSTVRWLSMNVVVLVGTIYYGIAVPRTAFGTYRQLLPLVFFQFAIFHAIAVAGILLTIAGYPNIFGAPEYSVGAGSQWIHALAHLTIGMVVPPVLGWGVASLVMLATRKLSRQPVTA